MQMHRAVRDVAGIPRRVDKQTQAVKAAMAKVDKRIQGSWLKVRAHEHVCMCTVRMCTCVEVRRCEEQPTWTTACVEG